MRIVSHLLRRIRTLAAAILVLGLLAPGAITLAATSASASVPQNGITHVYMNLDDFGSSSQQDQYQSLLNSLRSAIANTNTVYRGNTYLTQASSAGLVELTLTVVSTNNTVTLWIDPTNLYIMGFSNNDGVTWQFNDQTSLSARLSRTTYQMNGGYARTLPFGGSYGSLTASSGNNRDNMGINYPDILGSVNQLATVTDPTGGQANGSNQQWTARSLLLMVQFTSEAARFYDIDGVFRATMIGANQGPGLSAEQQTLENDWGQISNYGISVTNNPSTPPYVASNNPYIAFNSWADIATKMAVLLYTYSLWSGNPWNDEL